MKFALLLILLITTIPVFAQTPPPRPPREAIAPAPPHLPEKPLSPEMEREALEFLQMVAPFRVEETKALKNVNPPEFHERIMDILGMKRRLDFVKRNDPDRYELLLQEAKMDQQSQQLGEHYRRAKTSEERARLKQELRSLLDRLFDIREQNKQGEIKHLEEELARLKTTMAERRRNKAQIVTGRLEELLDEKSSLKW